MADFKLMDLKNFKEMEYYKTALEHQQYYKMHSYEI